MPGRLADPSDFPSKVKAVVVPPPSRDEPVNVLVLLHGLGDKKEAFGTLGKQMQLPETACVAIDGPNRLLDLDGFHWGDDILFNSTTGGLDADSGFKESTSILTSLVEDVLITKCGYEAREIVLLGFGQGGMAALNLALTLYDQNATELGGVVSIGAPLPSEATASSNNKCKTPILVCGGSDRTSIDSSAVDKLKRNFEFVEISKYRRPGDTMPSNRDEMMPIMKFFSRSLLSRKGVPKDSIPLS